MDNLLQDPLFRIETAQGLEKQNLPGLLTALGEDRVLALPGLQRHQEDAFHIFLCYLAGAVLARGGQNEPVQDEEFWREGLLALADGEDNAWKLVVEDTTQPAFMQAKLAVKADFSAYKPKAETPDELDLLQTAKNHDVKSRRAHRVETESWVYTLVNLQTMTGLMGRGNYGICRMNSGTGSRIRAGISYDGGFGAQWRRDTKKLLLHRQTLLRGAWGYQADGQVLTWLLPWNGRNALTLSVLDPFFIEIARAIRLVSHGSGVRALGAGTDGNRIEAKALKGLLGDPWTPIVREGDDEKAWTVMSRFSPKDLRDLVFGDERLQTPFMQTPDPDQTGSAHTLKLAVLAPGGMGKTNGFHEALIRVPGKAAGLLSKPGPERDRLATRSKEWLDKAGVMQNKVLKMALYSLLEAGPEQINFDKREVSAWVDQAAKRYAEAWAEDFFPWLWRSLNQNDDEAARVDWLKQLHGMAWGVLQNAIDRLPLRTGRGYRSRVRAEDTFKGCLYHQFPQLKKEKAHDHGNRPGS